MVARIRSFISSSVLSKTHTLKEEKQKLEYIDQSLEQLLLLGQIIIGPLLQAIGTDETHFNVARRQHSYLLPLEIIQSIITVADALDDIHIDTSKELDRMEFEVGIGLKQAQDENACRELEQIDQQRNIQAIVSDQVRPKEDTSTTTKHTVSEAIMTALFSSFAEHNSEFTFKPIRADAALPVLALAVDDIGSGKMASMCPAVNNGQNVTYWDCLRQTLDKVISCSVLCCAEAKNDDMRSQEGIHIIPHADYPALIRCIFRMISSNNSYLSTGRSIYPSWESLLLRSYHATVAIVLSSHLNRLEKYCDNDRMTILSTVQSHVLLPIFVGASVLLIRSILNSCVTECCSSCKKNSAVPSYIVAGFVLLIMRSRTSTSFDPLTSSANSFDPRSIIRMATEAVRKESYNYESQDETDKRSDNEFDTALKVLLSISGIESGSCPKCSGTNANNEAEIAAYDVLKDSLYIGDVEFVCRYENPVAREKSYYHVLGINTLSSYANLIRSSMTQGLSDDSKKPHSMEPFVTDTAKTWLDAAVMLLDDALNRPPESQSSNNKPNSAAFAVVIVLVVFFEVPSSQHEIIQTLYDRLLNLTSNDCYDDPLMVVISTLAWSMISKDSTSSKVFSRKDDMIRYNMAVFEPLCSLLSLPLSSSDHFGQFYIGSEALHISYSSAIRIAKSLITVSSARESILSVAKKHMRVFVVVRSAADSSLLANTSIDSKPCTQTSNRDSAYFATACLCMLIEKYYHPSISTVDSCGFEALVIITNLMVSQCQLNRDNLAQIPRLVSSWILAELNYLALNAKLSLWVCQRLLGASFYSLIECCNIEQEGHNGCKINATFLVDNPSLIANVDLTGLLRLSTTLFQIVHGTSMRPFSAQLVATLLCKNQGVASDLIEEGVRALENEVDAYDESNHGCIDRALFAVLIDGAAGMLHDNISSKWVQSDHSEMIRRYLLVSEQHHYKNVFSKDQHRSSSSLPDWLKTKHLAERGFTDQNVLASVQKKVIEKSCEAKQTACLLCDLIVELLAEGFDSVRENVFANTADSLDEVSDAFSESDLLLCVNLLWEKRHQISGDVKVSISSRKLYHLLNIYSKQLQRFWKEHQSLQNISHLESTIKHAMGVCTVLSEKRETIDADQYAAIWSVYCSLADEVSSCSLIALLLNVYKKSGWAPRNLESEKKATFSLTSIWSHEVLDDQILYIRTSILSYLTSFEFKTMLAPYEKSTLLLSLIRSLQKLCTDLSDGFRGQSGGMRKSLFLLYAEAIKRCITNISVLVDKFPVTILNEKVQDFTALNEAILILWNMFCEHCFKDTFIIKAILKMSADLLPALTRKIETIARRRVDWDTNLMPCVMLLDQANVELSQKVLRDSGTVTKNGETFEIEPNTVDFTQYPITQLVMPKLASENAVTWSHNIAFISMSTIWNELSKAVVSNFKTCLAVRSNIDQIAFAKQRLCAFQSMHSCICKMFNAVDLLYGTKAPAENTSNEHKEGKVATMINTSETARVIAELLPHRAKVTFARVLKKCL